MQADTSAALQGKLGSLEKNLITGVMALALQLLAIACLLSTSLSDTTIDELIQLLDKRQDTPDSGDDLQSLKAIVTSLARQSMLTQLQIEERVRSEGDSGLKQVRHAREGTKSYYADTIYGRSFTSNHDHANNIRTIGLGEMTAVLNGVEFRTRHNDYSLRMPSKTSTAYHATEEIPFPDVPQSVLDQTTVDEQISEMREWFKAWRDQDNSVRDYTKHFKPVLCYMEGMWTHADKEVEESFESDRHFLDADDWYELEEKARFQGYSGSKSSGENLAFLPRVIINVTTDGNIEFAQWNYNILCHPLENDIPFDRYKVVDDLSARMRNKIALGRYEDTRLARFQLNTVNEAFTSDSEHRHAYLDSLMSEIPGKNNYGAQFTDMGLSEDDLYMNADENTEPLNAGYYHRAFYVTRGDAMGQQFRYRGFADETLYMAMTDQDKVAGMKLTLCRAVKQCRLVSQKFSYAIPLEIIYLTPLSKWNPYDIPYRGSDRKSEEYKSVTADGRNGKPGKALNGTNSKNFYQTPSGFYDSVGGNEVDPDAADTTPKGSVAVLDSSETERLVRATGYRMFLPEIAGVGVLRQRWPIAPIHAEGSIFWKEIEAMKELVMDPISHGHLMYNPINAAAFAGSNSLTFTYETKEANTKNQGHVHEFTITAAQYVSLRELQNITVTTETVNGHAHTFLLYALDGRADRVRFHTCDGKTSCWDGHPKAMVEVKVDTVDGEE